MFNFTIRIPAASLVFIGLLLLSGCASGPARQQAVPLPNSAMAVDDYLIGIDDVVQVSVWRYPELGVTAPVRADGRITIPLIGDIQAGGRRPMEVSQAAQTALANYVRDPQVTVVVTELRSHEYLSRVRVTGAVRTPVSIPHRQGMTVLDAVLAAGGPTEFAAVNRSSLHRNLGNGEFSSHALPLARLLDQGDLSANHVLMPGDVITIPQRNF
jgi:polysaccharide biosynthesis/export protein